MSESTCLHIQDRESGPIRVVELPWISVRIGRAAYCEVCLPDERLPDESCRLTRRGRTWSLEPARGPSQVVCEGRPLDGPCPLAFDAPFRIGPYCLTLRRDVTAEPDWGMYPTSGPQALGFAPEPSVVEEAPAEAVTAREGTAGAAGPFAADVRPGGDPAGAGRSAGDPERWRARWKAAEAHFKARADRLRGGTGSRPVAYPAQPDPVRDEPRPAAEPVPRPTPRPAAPRIEPGWSVPREETTAARVPRVEPSRQPAYQPPDAVRVPGYSVAEAVRRDYPSAPVESALYEPASPDLAEPSRGDRPPAVIDDAPSWFAGPTIDADGGDAPTGEALRGVDPVPFREVFDDALAPSTLVGDVDPVEPAAPGRDEPEPEGVAAAPLLPDGEEVPPRRAGRSVESDATKGRRETAMAGGSTAASHRPAERGTRRRKPARDRGPGGRRGESPGRVRPDSGDLDRPGDRPSGGRPEAEVEWPTVRDILANHQGRTGPRPAVERRTAVRQALPTISRPPDQWTVSGWIALPPVGMAVMAVGLLACGLAWRWVSDASNAAVASDRLLAAGVVGPRRPLPEGVAPPRGRWIGTTAQHLAHWGVYLAGAMKEERNAAAEAPILLNRALEVSPLNPTARLALSQVEANHPAGPVQTPAVGLSRDSVSLAWSARRLAEAGKKEAALRLYGRALAAATGGRSSQADPPRFAEEDALRDEEAPRRYMLPTEDLLRTILVDLAARDGWTAADWSHALPADPVVLLTAARMLRERGEGGAEPLLDRVLGEEWPMGGDGHAYPRLLAARAEALVLRSKLREAAETYRQAIGRVDDDLVRRSWWFNLAEISRRLGDEPQRQAAIRSAVEVASSDEIARRARLLLKTRTETVVARPPRPLGSAKAN